MPRALVIALLVLVTTSRAEAVTNSEPSVEVDLAGPDGTVCYVRPVARRDPVACPEVDYAKLEAGLRPGVVVAGLVHRRGVDYVVTVELSRTIDRAAYGDTGRVLSEYVRDSGYLPTAAADDGRDRRGRRLVSLTATSSAGGFMAEHVVVGADRAVLLEVLGARGDLPTIAPWLPALIDSLEFDTPDHQVDWRLLLGALLVGAPLGVVLAIARRRVRRVADDDLDAWTIAQRQGAALRMFGAALALALVSVSALALLAGASRALARLGLISKFALVVAALLVLVGVITWVRAPRRHGEPA